MDLQQLFGLTGRTALVTGGSSGIGRGIARALAGAGAHVLVAARTPEALDATVAQIRDEGGSADRLVADLSTRDGAHALADAAMSAAEDAARSAAEGAGGAVGDDGAVGGDGDSGESGVDILVCSAGINLRPPMQDLDEAVWDATMAVNLDAPFVLGQRLAPGMAARGYGRLIHISSQQAHRPFGASGAYGVSKAALEALARSQAEAWSPHGVTANVLVPGFVPTALNRRLSSDPATVAALAARTLVGRNGSPDDFAGAAVLLAGPASAYITGQSIAVDGGFSVH